MELAKSVGVDMDGVAHTWGNALYETFDQKVEETLVQPTFITMYPVEVSPLAKRSPEQPALTERKLSAVTASYRSHTYRSSVNSRS